MTLQIVMIALCVILAGSIVSLVIREKLLLKYSLLWLALAFIVFLCAIFPGPLFSFASFLGFENPSNFVFLVGIFFLICIALSLTSIVSKQSSKIKTLTQHQGLLEKRINDLESIINLAERIEK